jgi:hypothetical protein
MSNQIKEDTPIKELIKKGEKANHHLIALLNARKEIHETGFGEDKKGHFKNKYIPIDIIVKTCEPILLKHDLLSECTEVPNSSDPEHRDRCRFRLTITYVKTMESVSSEITLYAENKSIWAKQSAYTYAKRSLFSSLLSLPTEKNEDDDGTGAVEENQKSLLQGRENKTTNKSTSRGFE